MKRWGRLLDVHFPHQWAWGRGGGEFGSEFLGHFGSSLQGYGGSGVDIFVEFAEE